MNIYREEEAELLSRDSPQPSILELSRSFLTEEDAGPG